MQENMKRRVQEEKSQLPRMLEIASVLGVLVLFYLVIFNWSKLPDSIPSHFNAAGKPDAWNGKWTLLILPIISLVLYISLTTLARFPNLYNFPWRITEENRERQFYLAKLLVLALKGEIIWLFTYIEWQVVQTSLNLSEGLGARFLIVFLSVIFGSIGIYFYKAYKER